MAKPKPKTHRIELHFRADTGESFRCHAPLDANIHELVRAASGTLLPAESLPLRVVRGPQVIAFYDPFAPIRSANLREGDVVEIITDFRFSTREPSFLLAYHTMKVWAAQATIQGVLLGHLPVGDPEQC